MIVYRVLFHCKVNGFVQSSQTMFKRLYHGALCRLPVGKLYPEVVASENEWKQMIKMKQAHANYISCLGPWLSKQNQSC